MRTRDEKINRVIGRPIFSVRFQLAFFALVKDSPTLTAKRLGFRSRIEDLYEVRANSNANLQARTIVEFVERRDIFLKFYGQSY